MKINYLSPQTDAVNKASAGTAFKGFDPVAYFTDGKPVYGSTAFRHTWRGVQWQFASAANLDAFKNNPEHYAPQYGGYCANAMSKNAIADVDPDAWTIVEAKLYMNFDKNARHEWRQDQAAKIIQADRYWRENENKRMEDQEKS